jgi:putative ABC transport system substrate-binding protein
MKCRTFIRLLGMAAARPFIERAQQSPKRIPFGVLWHSATTCLLALVALTILWMSDGRSQTSPEHPLVAFLGTSFKATGWRYYSGFLQGMTELGYVEGRDYAFVDRYADGDNARLPLLADEIVQLKPDVFVATPAPGVVAAKRATTTIPIVGINMTDPVGLGLIKSEARPGTNVTGNLSRLEGMAGKCLEVVRDLIPAARKIGVLIHAGDPAAAPQQRDTEATAAKMGVSLVPVGVNAPGEIDAAIEKFVSEHADAAVVLGDAMFVSARRQIAASALALRLPTIYNFREHVEDGGLISFGINLRENYRHAAYFVTHILKGAKPADLPIEFPTKVELVINLKTAKALGLSIPREVLARADDLVE